MTDSWSAPPGVLDLYSGTPLFGGTVRDDLLAYLTRCCGVRVEAEELVVDNEQDPDFAAILVRLWHVADGGSRAGLRNAISEAAVTLADLRAGGANPFVGHDLLPRLFYYLLQLGVPAVLDDIRDETARIAREETSDERVMEFLIALMMITPSDADVWIAKEGTVRAAVLSHARGDVSPESRRRLLDGLGWSGERAVLDHDEAIDHDRAGVVRLPPKPEHTLVVVPAWPDNSGRKNDGARAEASAIAGRALPLLPVPPDLVQIALDLRREYPHAMAAINAALLPLAGRQWIKMPNILLHGPAGTGKSELAQALGKALGLPTVVYACGGVHDAVYSGTSRQWHSARSSNSLQLVVNSQTANGLIVLDEIEKSGTGTHQGRLQDALLPFLERTTSTAILDPGLEVKVDLSALSYMATANGVGTVSRPLRDRFTLVEVPEPTWEHLGDLAKGIVERLRRERQTTPDWLPDLDGEEVDLLGQHWKGGSIRRLRRLVEVVLDGRDHLAARH